MRLMDVMTPCLALVLIASVPGSAHGQVTQYLQANQWMAQANTASTVERYAFDENWPGFVGRGGNLTPIAWPVNWTLTKGPVDIGMFIHQVGPWRPFWASSFNLRRIWRVRPGAAIVDGTSAGQSSGARLDVRHRSFWAFSPPIHGLFTFYSSMDTHASVTMTVYSGGGVAAQFTRGSSNNYFAQGHGFISTQPVNAVEFFYSGPDQLGGGYAIIGEFRGFASGQTRLLPDITIPGYQGVNGSTVPVDFAILP